MYLSNDLETKCLLRQKYNRIFIAVLSQVQWPHTYTKYTCFFQISNNEPKTV